MKRRLKLSDVGPLPWLVDFANIGIDRRQPQGRTERLRESRSLGLEGKRGYLEDPKGLQPEKTIELDSPFGSLSKQQRRDFTMAWYETGPEIKTGSLVVTGLDGKPIEFQPITEKRGKELRPAPSRASNVEEPPWDVFSHIGRPRAIMPIREEGPRWRLSVPAAVAPAGWREGDTIALTEEEVRASAAEIDKLYRELFSRAQGLLQFFLEQVWYLRHSKIDATLVWRRDLITTVIQAIGQSCLGQPSELQLPYFHRTYLQQDDLLSAFTIEGIVRAMRQSAAPIWMSSTPHGNMQFVSAVMPGIVWAEILNVIYHYPDSVSLLCWCSWCGAFFVLARGRGRPREFCSDPCRVRFHDYSPHESHF